MSRARRQSSRELGELSVPDLVKVVRRIRRCLGVYLDRGTTTPRAQVLPVDSADHSRYPRQTGYTLARPVRVDGQRTRCRGDSRATLPRGDPWRDVICTTCDGPQKSYVYTERLYGTHNVRAILFRSKMRCTAAAAHVPSIYLWS